MRQQLRLIQAVFANPQLRRLQLAWLATNVGVWGSALVLAVYAYATGGPAAVGLVALLRTLPGAGVAPFLAALADRHPRRRIMRAASVARAAITGALALAAAASAPLAAFDALVVLLALAGPAYGPAFTAMIPEVAQTPVELSSANVAESAVTNLGFLFGSLATGLVLAATSPAGALALLAAVFLLALVPLLGVDPGLPAPEDEDDDGPQLLAGFRTVAADRDLREIVLLTSLIVVVDGALDVLVVIASLGFLGTGESGAGYLASAWALGCVAGGAGVMALLGSGRLTSGITVGAAVVGIGLALFAVTNSALVALASLVGFGLGYTLIQVAGSTLLQRITPGHVLGRVAGVAETVAVVGLAIGSLGAALLADAIGARGALGVTASIVPLAVVLRRRALTRLDSRAPVDAQAYALLRAHEIFAPLPVATTERLAGVLHERRAAEGEAVLVQGEVGDEFYVVAEGTLDVSVDGVHVRTMGPGAGFGEIALVHDVPRSATVRATSDVVLLVLSRDEFLASVAGLGRSRRAADRVTAERLAAARPAALSGP